MTRRICPICKSRRLVDPDGPPDSKILVVGNSPGKLEVARNLPWIGPAGQVLNKELSRVGLQRDDYRITNMWLHAPAEPGTKRKPNPLYEKELNWHVSQLKNEFEGKRAILIMGSEPAQVLGLGSISEITGTVVRSDYFPESVEVVVAMVNPAQALHDLLGETRHAIQNFANALSSYNA